MPGAAVAINDGDYGEGQHGQKGWGGVAPDAIVFEKEVRQMKLTSPDTHKKLPGKSVNPHAHKATVCPSVRAKFIDEKPPVMCSSARNCRERGEARAA